MADEIKMDIQITIPGSVEVAGDMPEKWADGLTYNATTINDRRVAKIPDDGTFQSKVAVPSSIAYSPMIAAGFVSKRGRDATNIVAAQNKNLAASFDQWNNKLDYAFATVDGVVAKRFVDQVNNSKSNWADAVAKKTLRATGDKIRGRILGQVGEWMTGLATANQQTNLMQIILGAPYDYTWPGFRSAFRAAQMPRLMASLARILDADLLAAEITAQNAILFRFADSFRNIVGAPVKPFVSGGGALDSLYQFERSGPALIFHARVVLV